MRFSYALLGVALLNGCQLTGHKNSASKGSSSAIHQSVFYVNHVNKNSNFRHYFATAQRDVWDRIAIQLNLPVPDNERVRRYRDWYIKHPQHLRIVSQRAKPFLHLITEKIEKRKIPLEIALLPIVESSFDQFASSHVKAAGLWQFVPDTARRFGLEQTWWYDGRRDIIESTDAALDLLEYLHKKFDGDWLHALAAYNTGEGRVFRAIRLNERRGKPTDFWSLNLPKETSSYVPKLIAVADVLKNREKYGVDFLPIPNKPVVKSIKPLVPLNLDLAAKYAKISVTELHNLNPAYNRLSTSPNKMRQLLLPIDKITQFNINLARNTNMDHLIHRVQYGDALIKIAKEYDTNISAIQQANQLDGTRIRIGQRLIIPIHAFQEERPTIANQPISNPIFVDTTEYKIDYTVANGDSLWSIAQAHQVPHTTLASWNNMEIHDTIQVGEKLTIFTTEQPISSQSAIAKLDPLVYQIKLGDSLSAIAFRYNVSVAELKKWNSLDKDSKIEPGQELTLYVDANKA